MITVIVPIVLLLVIVLVPKIPYIGGNVTIGLALAGLTALIMGGIYNPFSWLLAWVDGIDRIAWVMLLMLVGCIYSETQVEIGTLDTVLRSLRAKFGHSPRGLVACTMIALGMAGALLGEAIASATIVGILAVKSMDELGLSGELICAILVIGGTMGSVMPPISQACFLSASLLNINPDAVINHAYITIGIGIIFTISFVCFFFVKKDLKFDESSIPKETAWQILSKNWLSLVPLTILAVLIVFRSLPIEALQFDLVPALLNTITVAGKPFLTWLGGILILKGFTNGIVLTMLFVTILTLFFPAVRKNAKSIMTRGLKNIWVSTSVQLGAAVMLGGFYAGGQIEAVKAFALTLNANVIKVGGSFAMTLMGMLTGSQATAQNTIFSFFGPILVEMGYTVGQAGIIGSHMSAAGQGLPPADLVTFAVAGVVGGLLGRKIDPLKSMFYSSVFCVYLILVSFVYLYLL